MSVAPRRPWLTPSVVLSFGLGLGFLSGCDQPTGSSGPRSSGPVVAEAEPAPPQQPAPTPDEAKPREILGKKTQDIRDLKQEEQKGGVATTPRIVSTDPIRIQGNAYVSIVGQNSILNIKHALDLYQAETGEFPKTTEEFMEKIIKANNIALAKLPFYQEYGYDAPSHSLVIIEYPARKKAAGYPE